MGWFLGIVAVLAAAGAVWGARRAGDRAARRVVRQRARSATRIHASTPTSVTLDADRRTLHRGQFGLWFGEEGHAVVGHARAHDTEAGTVTRELLHVTGDLTAAEAGYWTGHLHPGPASLRRLASRDGSYVRYQHVYTKLTSVRGWALRG